STAFNREHRLSLSQRIFSSYACAFLDDDPAYECCSPNLLTGSLSACRRSPRLLSNGYYVLTEDSFLSDEEGNITLTLSQTSVTYKENLVRVFRRRKKIRRSLDMFNLSASGSWLSNTVLSSMDSFHGDDAWLDGCSKLEASQNDIESRTARNYISQMAALILCLIISICTRYFLGGLSATLLLIILVFLLSQDAAVSSFFSLDASFKTTKF
ncbi:TMM71 protein, partial [Heliornis fulica]|nr:TMM71 protein [Heliornis fulica]